jgi:hypothetical protein
MQQTVAKIILLTSKSFVAECPASYNTAGLIYLISLSRQGMMLISSHCSTCSVDKTYPFFLYFLFSHPINNLINFFNIHSSFSNNKTNSRSEIHVSFFIIWLARTPGRASHRLGVRVSCHYHLLAQV